MNAELLQRLDTRMRVLTLALILNFPASTTAVVSDEANSVVLPSELCQGLFIVSMTVGPTDSTTLDFLLDTGASATYIDSATARRVIGPNVRADKVVLESVRIGRYEMESLKAYVIPLNFISLALRRNIDGILGFPVFKSVLLTLDYPAEEVRVTSGRLPRTNGREILRYSGFRRPHIKIDVGGRGVNVLLDSGSTGRFLLKPTDRLSWSAQPRPSRTVTEVAGSTVDEGDRLNYSIQVGPLRFADPIVFVAKRERLVGWHVLRHFELTFDQRKKRVRMLPRYSEIVHMAPYVGSGLGIRALSKGLEVIRVFPGTSAAASGLREGDMIIAIDGIPIQERRCADPQGEPADKRQVLTFIRRGTQAQAEIITEILIP